MGHQHIPALLFKADPRPLKISPSKIWCGPEVREFLVVLKAQAFQEQEAALVLAEDYS
jgi:hypothetical protein